MGFGWGNVKSQNSTTDKFSNAWFALEAPQVGNEVPRREVTQQNLTSTRNLWLETSMVRGAALQAKLRARGIKGLNAGTLLFLRPEQSRGEITFEPPLPLWYAFRFLRGTGYRAGAG